MSQSKTGLPELESNEQDQLIEEVIREMNEFYGHFVVYEHILHNASQEELADLHSLISQELARYKTPNNAKRG